MFTALIIDSLGKALRLATLLACLFAVLPAATAAQPGRISIELSTAKEVDVAPAGSTHRVALDATLQPQGNGLHVNSNEPLEAVRSFFDDPQFPIDWRDVRYMWAESLEEDANNGHYGDYNRVYMDDLAGSSKE